jgi:ribosomal protein S18 acetylase RimI-like enzyme
MSTEHKLSPINATVRPARSPDIPAIRLVAKASWRAAYRDILSGHEIAGYVARLYDRRALARTMANVDSTVLIALAGARVVGFCLFGHRAGRPEVYQLYVDPAAWGRGVGRRLLSHVEMQFLATGVRAYGLMVHRRNARAIMFYETLGFAHQAQGDRPDEWHMEKRIDVD